MYIKMVGDATKYQGTLENVGSHLIKVSGLIQHTSGFQLYLDNDVLVGDYSDYIYPYNNPNLGEGVFEYSNNNMVYEEVEAPTREEQEEKKIQSVITKTVGEDIYSLTEQIADITNLLTPIYEALLELQDKLHVESEEEEEEKVEQEANVEEENVEENVEEEGEE